ncbi:unnamed protein product [Auanema sp. JU1783]|nr:unnamed protein product [Auanema sp. JU1783]
MKIAWECSNWPGSHIESNITHLAWIPQSDDHGALGVGCDTGCVGITTTDFHPIEDDNSLAWNRAEFKLASCDAAGVIYVWFRNDDRWSVELVNDRGVKVRDLCWSPCGSSALIVYEDNFVLIGSSTGQRVWSNSYPAENPVLSGAWVPDSRHLILGFASGSINILTDQGANITERQIAREPIMKMACGASANSGWTLAMLSANNIIYLMRSFEQVQPDEYDAGCTVHHMQWNHEGTLLAFINSRRELVMLDRLARCVHREHIGVCGGALTALTWAHGGRAIIVAAGGHLGIGRVYGGVPSLFNLVTYDVWRYMGSSGRKADSLPVPHKEQRALKSLDHHIIRCRIPRNDELCQFVCSVSDARSYCTIRPMSKGSHSYVLCMEHLGGLVPILIGRQVNRFLPQFHISVYPSNAGQEFMPPAGSSAQVEDVSILPRTSNGRNSLWRRSKRHLRALMSRHVRPQRSDLRLAQVSSNVWCTKFNITSMCPKLLPEFLGQVVYKTSVLHLQPRQMTIDLALLSPLGNNQSRQPSLCPSPSSSEDEYDDMSCLLKNTTLKEPDGLTKEERAFFEKVVSECTVLRAAMSAGNGDLTPSGQGTSQVAASKESPLKAESLQGESDLTMSTTSTWHDEIESLDFIDGADDRDPLLPSTSGCHSMPAKASCSPAKTDSSAAPSVLEVHQGDRFRAELQSDLDRLVRIAGQLSHRHGFNAKRDRASITKMRSQMKELLRKVNEIEKKVANDDVRAEVRQLMRTLKEIKSALGEGRSVTPRYNRIITMHNKTPFWNEHNQVYQLDFGGRVTQESAKNFQVEVDGKQVLQFGRIEGGAYTLDFRRPLSASQAFSIALASITQRLK